MCAPLAIEPRRCRRHGREHEEGHHDDDDARDPGEQSLLVDDELTQRTGGQTQQDEDGTEADDEQSGVAGQSPEPTSGRGVGDDARGIHPGAYARGRSSGVKSRDDR